MKLVSVNFNVLEINDPMQSCIKGENINITKITLTKNTKLKYFQVH